MGKLIYSNYDKNYDKIMTKMTKNDKIFYSSDMNYKAPVD